MTCKKFKEINYIGGNKTRRIFEEIPALGDGDYRIDSRCSQVGIHYLQIEPCEPIIVRQISLEIQTLKDKL